MLVNQLKTKEIMMSKKKKPVTKPSAGTQTAKAIKTPSKAMSKALSVLELLSRDDGVTIQEICEATSWLPHTARAHLSTLRKKLKEKDEGAQIIKYTRDGKTMYKLEASGQSDV
jgi:hypothetical protein